MLAEQFPAETARVVPEVTDELYDPATRTALLQTLGYVSEVEPDAVRESVGTCIGLLDAVEARVVPKATWVLSNVTTADPRAVEPAVPTFVTLLKHGDKGVRRRASGALGSVADAALPAEDLDSLLALLAAPSLYRTAGRTLIEKAGVFGDDLVEGLFNSLRRFTVERSDTGATLGTADETPLVRLAADPEAPPRPADATGLFHIAVRDPSRGALADVPERVHGSDLSLTGASDHLVSEALYLRDLEGNGVEVYRDLPKADWPRTDEGHVEIGSLPLDLDGLAAEATADSSGWFPAGTDIGHVHLEVTDLARARSFYVDTVGFTEQSPDHREQALFVVTGGYHHHLALNTWNGRSEPNTGTRGLQWYELYLPDSEALAALAGRLDVESDEEGIVVTDPDGNEIRVVVEE